MSQPQVPGPRADTPAPVDPPRPAQPPQPPPPQQPSYGPLQHLIQAQSGNQRGDATAYLRAGAHLDPAFRDAVIEELAENPHRIPPPASGLDLVAVLKECFAARRWAVLRGLLMLAVPFAVIPVDRTGALLPLSLVLGIRWYLFLTRKLTGFLERLVARLGDQDLARWVRRIGLLISLAGVLWYVVLAAVSLWGGSQFGGSGSCRTDYYTGEVRCTDSSTPGSFLWAVLIVLLGWTAVAAVDRYRRLALLHQLATGKAPVAPDGVGGRAARYQQIRQQQADPDVVYSDYAPFVGAGVELDHWSFAIELARDDEAESTATTAFTVPTVHAHLRRELLRLGRTADGPTYPGDRLRTVSVEDHVFKSGMRVGPSQDWAGTGPGTAFAGIAPYAARAAAEQLGLGAGDAAPPTWWPDALDLAAEERLRHYLAVRVGSWGGEVVLTVFTRVQVQGGLLFIENRAFLLPPIDRAFHSVDTVTPMADAGDWLALVGRSLGSFLGLAGAAVPDLYLSARTAVRTARTKVWYDRMSRADRPVDHGPTCSVRELGAERTFHQLFQEMDVQRFRKSIQTRTLTALRGCLREHGYRTDEYDARQSVVINNGVQVGGNVTGNVQTGAHARASYEQQVSSPQPRIGTERS